MAHIDQKILTGIRDKLIRDGSSSLFDEELLALLLRKGDETKDVLTLSKHLLCHYDSLEALSEIPYLRLASDTRGMTEIKAITIRAAVEFAARIKQPKRSQARIDCSQVLAELVHDRMHLLKQECFSIALLNTKNDLISIEEITVGTLNASLVHAREIFRVAILKNAYSAILLHNHPSGDARPSEADKQITNQIKKAGEIIGIKILDHIIIGSYQYYSFEEGLHALQTADHAFR